MAEKYAEVLCDQGKGPVQIVSRWTGDVVQVVEEEADRGNV